MIYAITGILIMLVIFIAAITAHAGQEMPCPKGILCTENYLKGRPVAFTKDKSGLTRVVVEDSQGRLVYGFSKLWVEQLELICKNKDTVCLKLACVPETNK